MAAGAVAAVLPFPFCSASPGQGFNIGEQSCNQQMRHWTLGELWAETGRCLCHAAVKSHSAAMPWQLGKAPLSTGRLTALAPATVV